LNSLLEQDSRDATFVCLGIEGRRINFYFFLEYFPHVSKIGSRSPSSKMTLGLRESRCPGASAEYYHRRFVDRIVNARDDCADARDRKISWPPGVLAETPSLAWKQRRKFDLY
jgi:hypothetical protein